MAQQCPYCENMTVIDGHCMSCNRPVKAAPPGPPVAPPGNSANLPQSGVSGFINPHPSGNALISTGATQRAPAASPARPPQTIHNPPPIQIPQRPSMPLRNWQGQKGGPPYFEGVVDNVDGPHTAHSQPALWKQITAAMVLGKLNPWLGMGGYMMGKKDYHVWTCRLQLAPAYHPANNGSPAAIIFIFHNQPQLGFQLGDTVAVWGKPDDGGNLVMQRVYVYDTNTWVRVKK